VLSGQPPAAFLILGARRRSSDRSCEGMAAAETLGPHEPAKRTCSGHARRSERRTRPGPGGVRRVRPPAARAALPQGTNTCSARFKIMNALSNWPRNRLLLALSSRDLKRVMPELEHIRCQRAEVLLDADSSLDHVFFPDSGVVSVVAVYADGSVIEMATIGREGCTGMQAFFGARTSSVRLLVQIPGSATKMSRAAFTRAMESMPSFRNVMSAYIQAFLEQVLVSVACNGAHSLKQRLARWLLMMRDRGDEDALLITQNLLAEMLGCSEADRHECCPRIGARRLD
jgi:CRP-like cAMP-binding protein